VARSRLLFEGLESRILLNGTPAIQTFTITMDNGGADYATGASGSFALPQFNDLGGTRTLLSAELEIVATAVNGSHTVDSEDVVVGTATVGIAGEVGFDFTSASYSPFAADVAVANLALPPDFRFVATVTYTYIPEPDTGMQIFTIFVDNSGLNFPAGAGGQFMLPQFNDLGGTRTLLSVEMSLLVNALGGSHALDSEDPGNSGWAEVTIGATINAVSATVPALDVTSTPTETLRDETIAIDDEPAAPPDYAGDDSVTVVLVAKSDSDSMGLALPSDLSQFIGTGQIDFTFTSASVANHTENVGPVSTIALPPDFNFVATIIYRYPTGDHWRWDVFTGGPVEREFPEKPIPFQPMFSGAAEPGSTLLVSLYDAQGDLLGAKSVAVDAGGNWMVNFPDTDITMQPHTLTLRQTYAGYSAFADAGYNLRTYFVPSIMGGTYVCEHLTVENVLGKRASANAFNTLVAANMYPITLSWHVYTYELLSMPAVAGGY